MSNNPGLFLDLPRQQHLDHKHTHTHTFYVHTYIFSCLEHYLLHTESHVHVHHIMHTIAHSQILTLMHTHLHSRVDSCSVSLICTLPLTDTLCHIAIQPSPATHS